MKTLDCTFVSAKEPSLKAFAVFDCLPSAGDFVQIDGRSYRVLCSYLVAGTALVKGGDVFISVEPVTIPDIFSKAKSEDV